MAFRKIERNKFKASNPGVKVDYHHLNKAMDAAWGRASALHRLSAHLSLCVSP
jgi:hypothetical protein